MRKTDPAEAVVVLEAHAKASLPILESCAAMGMYVIAASSKRHCCGMYSRAVDERLVYPPVDSEPQKCLDFLLDFLRKRDVSVLLPVGDVMTDLVAAHQHQFARYTRFLLPEYETFVKGRNKILTLQAAQRASCPIPATWFPAQQSLEEIAREASYPLLIKPAISAGARGITICRNAAELLEQFPETERRFGECFVQEYVPQTAMQYKVDAVFDRGQMLLAAVVYEKLRYYPVNGGSSVLNRTVHRPDILDAAVRVMKELEWVGMCDFDFITDPHDGVVSDRCGGGGHDQNHLSPRPGQAGVGAA